ncbi:MAG: acetolactate synthase small subunit [Calditrichaeota bacterium]|nr:MAG: acetolactate synthase small subunit [Calditrichota bacterium]
MKHTINLLVENNVGSLLRIAGMFSGRGFNIDSISVGASEEEGLSRMTIVTHGDDEIIEQINKQLNKCINVVKVFDLTGEAFVHRELALIKVQATPVERSEIMQIVEVFRAKIIDLSPTALTVEATGTEDKISAIISMLQPFGLKAVSRTGRIALKREFQGVTV